MNAALADNVVATQDLPDEDDPVLAAFQGDATMTPGNPQPPEVLVPIPPLPEWKDPPTRTEPTSKHRFHAKEHSKKRRRAAATTLHGPSGTKRPLKAAAKRHRDRAVPLHASADTLSAFEGVENTEDMLVEDDTRAAAAAKAAADPILTQYSLQMEDVPVASTAFQGQRYSQTEADRQPKTLAQLWEEGITIIQLERFVSVLSQSRYFSM